MAFDDHAGVLDIERMYAACIAGEVVTHFRNVELRQPRRIGGAVEGTMLTIGSPASASYIRIYDKAAEQAAKGKSGAAGATGAADAEPWIRMEWQVRNQHAQSLMASFIAGGMDRAARLLAGVIEFKQASATDSNDRRWERVGWWARFLGQVEASKLALFRGAPSFKRSVHWLQHQTSTTLGMVMTAAGGDTEWLQRLLWYGVDRMGARHKAILAGIGQADVAEVLDELLGLSRRPYTAATA